MKVLLFGKHGQLGWELQRSLAPLAQVVALDIDSVELHADFDQPDALAATVRLVRPDVIVNAAAHTAVDQAEGEPERARRVNAKAPAVLAQQARAHGAWLVHFSTDNVFNGSGNLPHDEDAPTGPLNIYGQTKLEGELAIRASGAAHVILRTSWMYAPRGRNFPRTMLKLASEQERLTVVDDQFGTPTGADLLADITAHVIRAVRANPSLGGTYHAVPTGYTNWYLYARTVIDWARAHGVPIRLAPQALIPISTHDFPSPAKRPLNARLAHQKLCRTFGFRMPDWQEGVFRMLRETHPHRPTFGPNAT